jgi:hypothetical protein
MDSFSSVALHSPSSALSAGSVCGGCSAGAELGGVAGVDGFDDPAAGGTDEENVGTGGCEAA